MALTGFSVTVDGATATATLSSDTDLLSVSTNDFTLRRSDTNAVIGDRSDISIKANSQSGGTWTWTITITNSTDYRNNVYIQIRTNAFFENPGFARQPTSVLNSNTFKYGAATLPAPGTPGTLSAAAVDDKSIKLTFGASTGTVTQYQYRRASTSSGLSGATWEDGGTTNSITVSGLAANREYFFQVRACNDTSYSAASNTTSATTSQSVPVAPVAPGTPGTLSTKVIDHDSVELTFGASSGTVTQYQYKYATSTSGLTTVTWADGGTSTTITLHSLTPSTLYYFQVRACNQTAYSAASNTAQATTQSPPATAPSTPPSVTIIVVDHDTLRLTFGASTGTVTQYQYRYATSEATLATSDWRSAGTGRSVTIDGLSPSTRYYFQVRAGNDGAFSAASSTSEGITAAPPAPGGLSIEELDAQFIIVGTENYRLDIQIGGNPTNVNVDGLQDGFDHTWDAVSQVITVRNPLVERLQIDATWTVTIRKGADILTSEVKYNVLNPALIFHDLPLVYLYRDVPINYDILMEFIPGQVIPTSTLLGLKSELVDFGLKVGGKVPKDSELTDTKGSTTINVQLETGEVIKREYTHQVEPGDPPMLENAVFDPKGIYGKLTLPELEQAFTYEWTIAEGPVDAVQWNNSRPTIDPETTEVINGNLSVTIKFPNIEGVSSYEYRLDSETHVVEWVTFQGTLENGMITIIIPDLVDGIEYNLRIRVSSPWIGTPITIPISGSRLMYAAQDTGDSTVDRWLYIFSTGTRTSTLLTRMKRVRFPADIRQFLGYITVDSNGNVYVIDSGSSAAQNAIYTFLNTTIDATPDGGRLVADMRNPFPAAALSSGRVDSRGIENYGDELYLYLSVAAPSWTNMIALKKPTTDGADLELLRRSSDNERPRSGIRATKSSIFFIDGGGTYRTLDRELLNTGASHNFAPRPSGTISFWISEDLKTVFFTTNNRLYKFQLGDNNTFAEDFNINLPSGLINCSSMDII